MPNDYEQLKREIEDLKRVVREHLHNGADSQEVAIGNLVDMIPTVSTTPATTPKRFADQFRIGPSVLYLYDKDADAWFSVGGGGGSGTAFPGRVDSNAAGAVFPSGWSVSRTSAGVYAVSHHLGTTNYVVVSTAIDPSIVAAVHATTNNDFTIETAFASSGTLTDADFSFILVPA